MKGIPITYYGKPLKASWTYCAMDGAPFGVVGRYQNGSDKKDIVPFFRPNGSGWKVGIDLNPRPLFGLDKLAQHPKDKAVFIPEGEKAAAALQSIGATTVTSIGGSKAALMAGWTPLSGYQLVYLLPDNDDPGEQYIHDVYQALQALDKPPDVKILRLSGLPSGGDFVDWVQGWINGWDGYSPIPDKHVTGLSESFSEELKNAKPVPEDWGLAGSESVHFDEKKPGKIKSKVPPVQSLPVELLPEPFRGWVKDVSYRLQTPPDFIAISAIVGTGSIIGAGCSIKPKQRDSWEVIPNLWGACIARPSILLKSPCMLESMRLLDKLQSEYGEQYEQEKQMAEFDSLTNKAMLDDVKKRLSKAAKGSGKDGVIKQDDLLKLKGDFMELSQQAENEPVRRLFKTNETSIQAMTELQNQNPRGLLVFRDELTGLLNRWERDDCQDERAYYLEGFNGNGSYTDSKIGRGITDAKNICISVLGGLQPDKLRRYLSLTLEGNNDGMMQRFQLAVYPDEPNPNEWKNIDDYANTKAKNKVYKILKALADMDFKQYDAVYDEQHDDRPYYRFSDKGQAVFNGWLENLQKVKICQEENPLILEHLGKYRSLMPSLALIFHLIDIASDKPDMGGISAQNAKLAAKWCEYLESHARRIYAMAESLEDEAAINLAGKIKDRQLPNPFTAKMAYDKGWYGLKDKESVQAAINKLIEENWLVMKRKPIGKKGGRPPAPEYHVNPKIFSKCA